MTYPQKIYPLFSAEELDKIKARRVKRLVSELSAAPRGESPAEKWLELSNLLGEGLGVGDWLEKHKELIPGLERPE